MAYLNRPDFYFGICFNADPGDAIATPVWNDLTKYVRSMSSLARGIQYELATSLAADPSVLLRDVDENLNSANPSSPYYPNVVPWRRALFMGTWPNGAAGNVVNLGAWRGNGQFAVDPTFDTYTAGTSLPWWVGTATVATTTVTIDTTTPRSGANCILATWTGTTAGQGATFTVRTMPGRQYTTSAYVRLASANTAAIAVVGGVTGTTTTTVGSYVRLSVTFTATQPLTVFSVASSGVTAAGALRVDDFQTEQGASASAFTTSGPVIYPIMAPYTERFQKTYQDGGFTGYVTVPCVDSLAALSNISIGTDYTSALGIQYTPDHWWPLAGGDATTAYLPGPSNKPTPPMTNLVSKYGLGAGSLPQPGTTTNIAGDAGGTGVTFTPPNPLTAPGKGAILATSTPLTWPAVAGSAGYSATIAAWVTVSKLNAGDPPTLVFPVSASYATSQPPSLAINSTTGQIYAQVGGTLDGAFPSLFFMTDGPNVADGLPHLLVMTVVQDVTNTVLRAYVDGIQVLTGLSASTPSIGGVLLPSTTGKSVQLGGFFAFTAYEDQLVGQLAHVALWDSALSGAQITDLKNAGLGYAGIQSGGRVRQHIVTYGRYTGLVRISNGSTLMEAPSAAGTIDLLSDTNNTTDAELGRLWAAPDGAIVWESRQDRYLRLTSGYTLGQNVAGGNIPFDDSVEMDTDPQYIYVNVRYSRSGGSTATGGSVADVQAAALRYFYPPFEKTVDVQSDATAQDLANWIFYTHNGAVQRIASITLDPASNPALWAFCLTVECGQRLTVSMRAPAANGGAGLTFVNDFFVENVTHDGIDADTGTWFTTLWMSSIALGTPQSAQPWILENASYGILDSTTKLAP